MTTILSCHRHVYTHEKPEGTQGPKEVDDGVESLESLTVRGSRLGDMRWRGESVRFTMAKFGCDSRKHLL